MPDFLRRLLLLAAVNVVAWKVVTLNISHHAMGALLALVVAVIANIAVWKWEFR